MVGKGRKRWSAGEEDNKTREREGKREREKRKERGMNGAGRILLGLRKGAKRGRREGVEARLAIIIHDIKLKYLGRRKVSGWRPTSIN